MLNIPYQCVSASDPDRFCQMFMKANFAPDHIHHDLNSQLCGDSCTLHPDGDFLQGLAFGSVNFFQAGTPCPPFSCQRAKRNLTGSVRSHKDYQTTVDIVSWLQHFEPEAGCLEQVSGFNAPEDQNTDETPLERQGFVIQS